MREKVLYYDRGGVRGAGVREEVLHYGRWLH